MKLVAASAFVVWTALMETLGSRSRRMGTTDASGWTSTKQRKNNRRPPQPTTVAPQLVVQTGRDCSMAPQATGSYTFTATLGNATVLFSERPVRMAQTIPTPVFVEQFHNLFATSNPNAAVTFSGENVGPVIVVLSRPRLVGDDRIIEYTLTQSASQGAVVSIENFLDMSGSVSCSIFIDGFIES